MIPQRVAGGVRLSARVAASYPEIMQILCHSQLGRIYAGDGLAPRAKRDVEQGMAAGRFTVADPVIALTLLNGGLLALLELWCNQPEADRTGPRAQWQRSSCICSAFPRMRPVTSPGGPFPPQREEDPAAHRPTGADCAPAPAACVIDRGG
ncbi:hypothetical protein [Streptomyces avermitilis]|uniref:hypothetical protein n=1 Tax=Streptomyces avermitilis TaxID=33903 RepID=UPI00367EF96D